MTTSSRDAPRAERSDWTKLKKFAASDEEYGLPAPEELGYSYRRLVSDDAHDYGKPNRTQSISIPEVVIF